MSNLSEDDIALAAEYVLGLLDSAAEAAASARMVNDAEFAKEVAAWRDWLLPLLDGNDTDAPENVWNNIHAALSATSAQNDNRPSVRLWQALTALSVSAAAILAVLLIQQPAPTIVPEPEAPLIAALGSDTEKAAITASYNKEKGEMLLTPVSLDTGRLYPELWVIPADGTPHSLGIVSGEKPSAIIISADMRQFLDEGATLAITPEPQTGGPGGKPSGPVIASGKIVSI